MTEFEKLFRKIANQIPSAVEGKMFGAMSIKAKNGKTAAFFWNDSLTFKLDEKSQQKALKLKGAGVGFHIYAPERSMKGWVTVPPEHSNKWIELTNEAVKYVGSLR